MISNTCKLDVITLEETNGNYQQIKNKYMELRKEGWEPLIQLTGDNPKYYASLYKPSKKSLTKFN